MKNLFFVMFALIFASNVYAFDHVYEGTIEDFEDFTIKENGIKINNFSIAEKQAFMTQGLVNVVVSFSVRNQTEVPKHFSAMIVGKSGESILWAISAEPMMSTISANKTEAVNSSSYITPGVVSQTQSIWLRIVGDL